MHIAGAAVLLMSLAMGGMTLWLDHTGGAKLYGPWLMLKAKALAAGGLIVGWLMCTR